MGNDGNRVSVGGQDLQMGAHLLEGVGEGRKVICGSNCLTGKHTASPPESIPETTLSLKRSHGAARTSDAREGGAYEE